MDNSEPQWIVRFLRKIEWKGQLLGKNKIKSIDFNLLDKETIFNNYCD